MHCSVLTLLGATQQCHKDYLESVCIDISETQVYYKEHNSQTLEHMKNIMLQNT